MKTYLFAHKKAILIVLAVLVVAALLLTVFITGDISTPAGKSERMADSEHSAFAQTSESSLAGETPLSNQNSTDSPPIQSDMAKEPENQVRRFSKNNPANVEVFRRDGGQIKSFDKTQPDADAIPHIDPPTKPKI